MSNEQYNFYKMITYIIVPFLSYIYNITLLAGTSYLVFYKGISPWWFIVTLCCLSYGVKLDCHNKKDNKNAAVKSN